MNSTTEDNDTHLLAMWQSQTQSVILLNVISNVIEDKYLTNVIIIFLKPRLQLSDLQRENVRLRAELEREITARQTLQLQVESKDNLLSSFRSQVDPNTGTLGQSYMPRSTISDILPRTPGKDRHVKVCSF